MWITSAKTLWLAAAILWTIVWCVASGVVVGADRDEEEPDTTDDGAEPDFLPDFLARSDARDLGIDEQYERRDQLYSEETLERALLDIDDDDDDDDDADDVERSNYHQDDLSCTELRSKKYISDGFCTSAKPIAEVICAGECIPTRFLDWGAGVVKFWSPDKTREWRCVNDVVRQRRVHLLCSNNDRRTYRIKTVKSCKCKRYHDRHNRPDNGNDNGNANEGSPRQSRDDRRKERALERRRNVEEESNRGGAGGDRARQRRIAESVAHIRHRKIRS